MKDIGGSEALKYQVSESRESRKLEVDWWQYQGVLLKLNIEIRGR